MHPKPSHRTDGASPLTIGALSRATGIPAETLRTWERRYGAPQPLRKPSGHRLYPSSAIEHLRRVRRLLQRGHRAGEIVRLSIRELDAMLRLAETRHPGPGGLRADPTNGSPDRRATGDLVRVAMDLDRESLMREFRMQWVRLGPLRFLKECAGAFLTEIGDAWSRGTLEIRHEHFASSCVTDFLREVREPYDHEAKGPRIAAATLPGDTHDGGLLMACVLMAVRGWRVVYLGVNTPIDEIAAAVNTGHAEHVALSVSLATGRSKSTKAITHLRAALPPRTPLWVGGAGAPAGIRGAVRLETLEALDARLTAGI